jgi:starch phosphorylase
MPSRTASTRARVGHPVYGLLPTDIEGFDSLVELALDMRWSWNHATDGVWRQLDAKLWEITHNPWVVLQTASREKIEGVLADPVFRKDVEGFVQTRRQAIDAPAWFSRGIRRPPSHALPISAWNSC